LAGATVEDVGFDERATVAGVEQLLEVARRIAPNAGESWFRTVRVGLRPGTSDGLPVVGASARLPGLVYATGHYRSGILLTPLTALLVAGIVLDSADDPALSITAPSRFGEV
jgi:glycine oxidase